MNLNNKRTQFLQTFISCLRYSLGCDAVMMNGQLRDGSAKHVPELMNS